MPNRTQNPIPVWQVDVKLVIIKKIQPAIFVCPATPKPLPISAAQMKIEVKATSIVKPAEPTPRHNLWVSNLDLVHVRIHMTTLHFYKRIDNGGSDFFDSGVLKRALSEVLVPFYPVAGRLGRDKNGRVEIVCNEDGVLFVEAESDCVIDELGESIQTSPLPQLVPPGDDGDLNLDISSFPLLLVQVYSLLFF